MMGVLNESTEKVHKREPQRERRAAACGAMTTVSHDRFSVVPVDEALDRDETTKCGRCFSEGGGY